MSRFSGKSAGTKTENLAGGEAFANSPELELISILLTSFGKDKFYRTVSEEFERVHEISRVCNPRFSAKAAIYARNEFGMRSITHVLAACLAKRLSGIMYDGASFYDKIIRRPDDMMEIYAYYSELSNGKNPTNAMKKGFARAIGRFSPYQLAKYRNEGKEVKLVDIVNLVHPKGSHRNKVALRALIDGKLKSHETWETKLTQAGQNASNDQEKKVLKAEAWKSLLSEDKLGYFALLRNINNILEQAPELIDILCEKLKDPAKILGSLVLPFRYLTAIKAIETSNKEGLTSVMLALHIAVNTSCSNIPLFEGKTLVVLDDSGSMGDVMDIASLFAAAFMKSDNDADFMQFSDTARYMTLDPGSSVLSMARSIRPRAAGTNFHAIFQKANKAYDRIIILTDMQGWVGYNNPAESFNKYKKSFACKPKIFSWDLMGYGSNMFKDDVFHFAGFSEKAFELMGLLDQDKNALMNKINSVEL